MEVNCFRIQKWVTFSVNIRKEAKMQKIHQFTAVIEREDNMYVALCPELDIASQGDKFGTLRSIIRQSRVPSAEFEA